MEINLEFNLNLKFNLNSNFSIEFLFERFKIESPIAQLFTITRIYIFMNTCLNTIGESTLKSAHVHKLM